MKNNFNDNETIGCTPHERTKKEMKQDLARSKKEYNKLKGEMANLSSMWGNYTFNQQSLEQLVGGCYIATRQVKARVKKLQKELNNAK